MKRACTLIEAVVVIVIILILAAILFPVLKRPDTPTRGPCQSNLKQIGLGFIQYAQDYDYRLPPVRATSTTGWADILQPYLKSWPLFQCPAVSSSTAPPIDYFYNRHLSRLMLKSLKTPASTILSGEGDDDAPTWSSLSQLPFSWNTDEKSPAWRHLDGANYGFTDGHVKWLKPSAIKATISTSKSQPTFAVR